MTANNRSVMIDTKVVRAMADILVSWDELSKDERRRFHTVMHACAEEIEKLRDRVKNSEAS